MNTTRTIRLKGTSGEQRADSTEPEATNQVVFCRFFAVGSLLSAFTMTALSLTVLPAEPALAEPPPGEGPVVIAVKSSAVVHKHEIVRIADIAELRGGRSAVRNRIAGLDLSAPPADGEPVIIPREVVDIRLQLAGLPSSEYRVEGADAVHVVRGSPALTQASHAEPNEHATLEAAIVKKVRAALAKQFAVDSEDLQIALTRPLPEDPDLPTLLKDGLEVRPVLPVNPQPGRIRVQAGLYLDGRLNAAVPVSLDVRVFRKVARARHRIPQGGRLTRENVSIQRVATHRFSPAATAEEVLGKTSKRPLAAGQVIRPQDLQDGEAENPILIRPRDVVRLVARSGSLTVVVSAAEALQPGRRGDSIRVRNTRSRRVVVGRVVSRSEVEVPL